VTSVPDAPTATNLLLNQITALSVFAVPEALAVHVIPSVLEVIIPVAPTITAIDLAVLIAPDWIRAKVKPLVLVVQLLLSW
jgi:hypothetical protein